MEAWEGTGGTCQSCRERGLEEEELQQEVKRAWHAGNCFRNGWEVFLLKLTNPRTDMTNSENTHSVCRLEPLRLEKPTYFFKYFFKGPARWLSW